MLHFVSDEQNIKVESKFKINSFGITSAKNTTTTWLEF